jgi:hypothetical protein
MKKNYLILLGLTVPLFANGQEATPTSGGDAFGSGGSASYTIGQVVFTSNNNLSGIVSQGVQQPFEILVVSGIKSAEEIYLECSVFPNPTNELINLRVANCKFENLSMQLYDTSGKLLQSKKVEGDETFISMVNFIPANYLIKVTQGNKEVKTFKIIKN